MEQEVEVEVEEGEITVKQTDSLVERRVITNRIQSHHYHQYSNHPKQLVDAEVKGSETTTHEEVPGHSDFRDISSEEKEHHER